MTEDALLTWTEIDLDAIGHNVRALRRITSPDARFMAVVKADGYGHGAAEVARIALKNGAEWLGVARIGEGIALRKAGLDVPILIFGHTPPALAQQLLEWHLAPAVFSPETARAFSDAAVAAGRKISIHLKVDTGMGRLGLLAFPADAADRTVRDIAAITRLPGIEAEGIFTHFAASDTLDKTCARTQLARFTGLTDRLRAAGVEIPIRHCANSAGLMELPEAHLDMVRAGIALYGLYPSDEVDREPVALKPAMSFKARIIQVKSVPAGFKISYGMAHETTRPTVIASVSAGYADGLNRLLSSKGHMLVRGQRAPIVGRICMDLCMLDVGHIPDVAVGDEVVIFGTQKGETLHVDELAATLSTISYEIVSTITGRVPRLYTGS
ncbi:alanine racemase [Desulfonema ishimotonii]|uniref:Alanine racemase n=1 Tax=Desulfonema ishimotonii TaxID=45657 RepID=A0A401FR72_9BACT|nr:alanine racemase [Desulfonema ishimotonii]GBC59460.1 alanine racemase [Desulfonema ishimotonii]